jgi:hypothetical protein
MNGFPYRLLVPRKDYGAGCDEARFYGSIAKLKSLLPAGVSVRIADRDSRPTNWAGPQGVSELEFVAGSRGVIDRVWIGPLTWIGTPPADGNGANRLGQNQCFQFFDLITDATGIWPNARASIVETLGIMP